MGNGSEIVEASKGCYALLLELLDRTKKKW